MTTTEQLFQAALALPEPDRLALADALLAASSPPVPAQTGDAWQTTLARSAEAIAGEAKLTPWPEVRDRVRAIVGSR